MTKKSIEKGENPKSMEELLKTIQDLTEKVDSLETKQETHGTFDALQEIDKTGRVDDTKIKVQEFTSHKNISLWTKDGKRIGPLHPHNAKQTLMRFKKVKGEDLLVRQPTQGQIDAYKLTLEYKAKQKKFEASRAIKDKTRNAKSVEKIAKSIAAEMGKTVAEITGIKKPGEVGKVGV